MIIAYKEKKFVNFNDPYNYKDEATTINFKEVKSFEIIKHEMTHHVELESVRKVKDNPFWHIMADGEIVKSFYSFHSLKKYLKRKIKLNKEFGYKIPEQSIKTKLETL